MTSSSNPTLERGLDTMFLVYGLLQNHPASAICEQWLQGKSGWFAPALALLEAKNILTKVYGVDPALVSQKLVQLTYGPVTILDVDISLVVAALGLADKWTLDLTDTVLHLWSGKRIRRFVFLSKDKWKDRK